MIDYLAELYVKVLILLSCIGWAALLSWGAIYLAEKILRWVYQDEPQQLYTSDGSNGLAEVECEDCGKPIDVSELDEIWPRCDLCTEIWFAELEHHGRRRD